MVGKNAEMTGHVHVYPCARSCTTRGDRSFYSHSVAARSGLTCTRKYVAYARDWINCAVKSGLCCAHISKSKTNGQNLEEESKLFYLVFKAGLCCLSLTFDLLNPLFSYWINLYRCCSSTDQRWRVPSPLFGYCLSQAVTLRSPTFICNSHFNMRNCFFHIYEQKLFTLHSEN